MASESLWDQLAQRKRRTLEARARRGEPLVRENVTETAAQAHTDVPVPAPAPYPDALTLAGITLPLGNRNIIGITIQLEHEQQVYPVNVCQRPVPESMSVEQLFEQSTYAREPTSIIDTSARLWQGYEGCSRDMYITRHNEDYMQRLYAVRLAYGHNDPTWLEISTEFPLQWRDTASWLLAFEQLLDKACFITTQQNTTGREE